MEERQVSGIVLPEGAIMHAALGLVLAVGNGAYTRDGDRIPMDVQAGDYVRYPSAVAAKLPDLDGRELHMVQAAHCYGIVPEATARQLTSPLVTPGRN
jgi:chaperonin GroES